MRDIKLIILLLLIIWSIPAASVVPGFHALIFSPHASIQLVICSLIFVVLLLLLYIRVKKITVYSPLFKPYLLLSTFLLFFLNTPIGDYLPEGLCEKLYRHPEVILTLMGIIIITQVIYIVHLGFRLASVK